MKINRANMKNKSIDIVETKLHIRRLENKK